MVTFLTDLAHKARAQGRKSRPETFVRQQGHTQPLQAWDIAHYSEKRAASYAISDEMLRPYFPEDKVLLGYLKWLSASLGSIFTNVMRRNLA